MEEERQLIMEAKKDHHAMQRYFMKANLRRAVPPQAAPNELWRQLTSPPKERPKRREFGAEVNMPRPNACQGLLRRGLQETRRGGRTPVRWHSSMAVAVRKNAVKGPKGMRIYHVMDPAGEAYFAGALRKKKFVNYTDCDYGFVEGRRREGR